MAGICLDCGAKVPREDNCCAECFDKPVPRPSSITEAASLTCRECGKQFEGTRFKKGGHRNVGFCSQQCTHAFMEKRYTKTVHCFWCGVGFNAHHAKRYCSENCRVAAHRAGKKPSPNGDVPRKAKRPPLLKLRFDILERDHFRCRYGVVLHIDHVNPVSNGGEWAKENLLTACQECNLGKSDRILTSRAPSP
jgi:hypothetical protein